LVQVAARASPGATKKRTDQVQRKLRGWTLQQRGLELVLQA
jgi:hypothetical protein